MEVGSHLFLVVLGHKYSELNLEIYKSLVFFYSTNVMVKVNCVQWLHVDDENSYLEQILVAPGSHVIFPIPTFLLRLGP